MGKHRQQLDSQECNRLSVHREQFWEDCVVFFKNPKFNPRYPLRIRFAGEAGLDAGGLRREFGSLLVSCSPQKPCYLRVVMIEKFLYTMLMLYIQTFSI